MALKRCSRFGFIVVVAVLVMPIASFACAATACDHPADRLAFHLIPVHLPSAKEETATRDDMNRIAARIGASDAVRKAHPLMLNAAETGTDLKVANRIIEGHDATGKAYFCDAPNSVVVLLGAFKQTIILYDRAATDPCIRQTLLEHQLQHSHVFDETLDRFVGEHRDKFARAIRALARETAPDAASATRTFKVGLMSLIGGFYQQFELEVGRSRLDADTPAALDQLRNACDGRLHQLELELAMPENKHAALSTKGGRGSVWPVPRYGSSLSR